MYIHRYATAKTGCTMCDFELDGQRLARYPRGGRPPGKCVATKLANLQDLERNSFCIGNLVQVVQVVRWGLFGT